MFLALLILPLLTGALVIALAWRTIPGFVEQEQKRQVPMVLAILISFLTMRLGSNAIFPLLPNQHDRNFVPCETLTSLDQPKN